MANSIKILGLAMYPCLRVLLGWADATRAFAQGWRALAAFLFAAVSYSAAAANGSAAVVGEATLVIGEASLLSADGTRRTVERGTHLRVGDQMETSPGGHVHLRFIDGARVSVRPGSRLQVDSYSNPSDPSDRSGIRFRLSEGVIRSITGQWGEIAKDKFRLNTPVAAIGVKGTDFVVRSEGDGTAAAVFSGAIVLSPMTDKCVSSLGPCLNGAERVLTDTMKGVMLELKRQDAVPQLVPAVDLQAAVKSQVKFAAQTETGSRGMGQTGAAAAADAPKADSVDTRGSASAVTSSTTAALSPVTSMATAGGTPVQALPGGAAASPVAVIVDTRAAQAVSAASKVELPPAQVGELLWGRFAWAPVLSGDDYSKAFEFALLQDRQRLGGNGAYTLLRSHLGGDVFAPVDPSAKFRLAGSAATVIRTDGLPNEVAKVNSGTLEVNFAQSSYVTELQLQAGSAGIVGINSSGSINSDGTLKPQAGNALVIGGFNTSGKEAGYLFQKPVAQGQLMGTTLWGR